MKIEIPVWMLILFSLLWMLKSLLRAYRDRMFQKLMDSGEYKLLEKLLATLKWNEDRK